MMEQEIERAKRAKPLPLDASWSTGDEDFDARIRAGLMQRDDLLSALEAWQSLRFECVEDGSSAPRDGCACSVCDTTRESAAAIARAEGRR